MKYISAAYIRYEAVENQIFRSFQSPFELTTFYRRQLRVWDLNHRSIERHFQLRRFGRILLV